MGRWGRLGRSDYRYELADTCFGKCRGEYVYHFCAIVSVELYSQERENNLTVNKQIALTKVVTLRGRLHLHVPASAFPGADAIHFLPQRLIRLQSLPQAQVNTLVILEELVFRRPPRLF
jgi:hypothetical protein